MLILCDRRGIPISASNPIAGNHNDTYELKDYMEIMLEG